MTMQTPTPDHPLRTVVLLGSTRAGRLAPSIGGWVADRLTRCPDLDGDLLDVAGLDLPDAALRPGGGPDSPVSERLTAADAFLVVTPEYNHSFPAGLKNAVDWHYREWARKPVGFVSYGARSGGIRAVEQLRLVFAELSATTTRTAVALVTPWEQLQDGRFAADDGQDAALDETLRELAWWARALRAARLREPVG